MGWRALAHRGAHADGAVRLALLDVHHVTIVQGGQVHGQVGLLVQRLCQGDDDSPSYPYRTFVDKGERSVV